MSCAGFNIVQYNNFVLPHRLLRIWMLDFKGQLLCVICKRLYKLQKMTSEVCNIFVDRSVHHAISSCINKSCRKLKINFCSWYTGPFCLYFYGFELFSDFYELKISIKLQNRSISCAITYLPQLLLNARPSCEDDIAYWKYILVLR